MDRRGPVAFFSYVRADDAHDGGTIRRICERLSAEMRAQTGTPFHIFIDRNDIDWGENWKARIDESLEMSTILIPIITPSYFLSRACRDEMIKFLQREAELGRNDLVLPIYYIRARQLEDPAFREKDSLAQELSKRQYVDWRHLRSLGIDSKDVRESITELAERMQRALERGDKKTMSMKDLAARLQAFEALHPRDSTSAVPDLDTTTTLSLLEEEVFDELEVGHAYLVPMRRLDSDDGFRIDNDIMFIGRDSKSDIFLRDMSVSRRHAEIRRMGDDFRIIDMDSTNGVWVNRGRVSERDLETGDEVRIGRYTFLFVDFSGS
jgi:hypothetical protein